VPVLLHKEVQARKRSPPEEDVSPFRPGTKHQVLIFPVVVYLRGGAGLSEEEFVLELFGQGGSGFWLEAVALARFEAREYVEKRAPARRSRRL
jgi:hypothetical protein